MNERIRQLFEQAFEEFKAENKYATIIVPNPLKEKFAELIVRECARVYWNIDDGEIHSEYVNALKQHFGVEE